jgi:catechol 2,3-dioxygenase-like lactoylglutathione lyase family enzyme
MALHGLSHVTIGVPNPAETEAYYTDFGLTPRGDGWFATQDGGDQLEITHSAHRRLVELGIAADDADDLDAATARLGRLGIPVCLHPNVLRATEPITGSQINMSVTPRIIQPPAPPTPYNGPGRVERTGKRAAFIDRTDRVRPRKLGHAVLGTTDLETTMRFFVEGLGFKASDYIKDHGAFLRCSTDHHNVLVLAAPVCFLHHTSWQVEDIDEVGRGAFAMLEDNPERHVWGLGRHHAGSNFFWYLKDPAGNFSEYYSDMDCIVDDQLWSPETLEGAKGLFNWGPPPPPSFLHPEDLAALMTGAHKAP